MFSYHRPDGTYVPVTDDEDKMRDPLLGQVEPNLTGATPSSTGFPGYFHPELNHPNVGAMGQASAGFPALNPESNLGAMGHAGAGLPMFNAAGAVFGPDSQFSMHQQHLYVPHMPNAAAPWVQNGPMPQQYFHPGSQFFESVPQQPFRPACQQSNRPMPQQRFNAGVSHMHSGRDVWRHKSPAAKRRSSERKNRHEPPRNGRAGNGLGNSAFLPPRDGRAGKKAGPTQQSRPEEPSGPDWRPLGNDAAGTDLHERFLKPSAKRLAQKAASQRYDAPASFNRHKDKPVREKPVAYPERPLPKQLSSTAEIERARMEKYRQGNDAHQAAIAEARKQYTAKMDRANREFAAAQQRAAERKEKPPPSDSRAIAPLEVHEATVSGPGRKTPLEGVAVAAATPLDDEDDNIPLKEMLKRRQTKKWREAGAAAARKKAADEAAERLRAQAAADAEKAAKKKMQKLKKNEASKKSRANCKEMNKRLRHLEQLLFMSVNGNSTQRQRAAAALQVLFPHGFPEDIEMPAQADGDAHVTEEDLFRDDGEGEGEDEPSDGETLGSDTDADADSDSDAQPSSDDSHHSDSDANPKRRKKEPKDTRGMSNEERMFMLTNSSSPYILNPIWVVRARAKAHHKNKNGVAPQPRHSSDRESKPPKGCSPIKREDKANMATANAPRQCACECLVHGKPCASIHPIGPSGRCSLCDEPHTRPDGSVTCQCPGDCCNPIQPRYVMATVKPGFLRLMSARVFITAWTLAQRIRNNGPPDLLAYLIWAIKAISPPVMWFLAAKLMNKLAHAMNGNYYDCVCQPCADKKGNGEVKKKVCTFRYPDGEICGKDHHAWECWGRHPELCGFRRVRETIYRRLGKDTNRVCKPCSGKREEPAVKKRSCTFQFPNGWICGGDHTEWDCWAKHPELCKFPNARQETLRSIKESPDKWAQFAPCQSSLPMLVSKCLQDQWDTRQYADSTRPLVQGSRPAESSTARTPERMGASTHVVIGKEYPTLPHSSGQSAVLTYLYWVVKGASPPAIWFLATKLMNKLAHAMNGNTSKSLVKRIHLDGAPILVGERIKLEDFLLWTIDLKAYCEMQGLTNYIIGPEPTAPSDADELREHKGHLAEGLRYLCGMCQDSNLKATIALNASGKGTDGYKYLVDEFLQGQPVQSRYLAMLQSMSLEKSDSVVLFRNKWQKVVSQLSPKPDDQILCEWFSHAVTTNTGSYYDTCLDQDIDRTNYSIYTQKLTQLCQKRQDRLEKKAGGERDGIAGGDSAQAMRAVKAVVAREVKQQLGNKPGRQRTAPEKERGRSTKANKAFTPGKRQQRDTDRLDPCLRCGKRHPGGRKECKEPVKKCTFRFPDGEICGGDHAEQFCWARHPELCKIPRVKKAILRRLGKSANQTSIEDASDDDDDGEEGAWGDASGYCIEIIDPNGELEKNSSAAFESTITVVDYPMLRDTTEGIVDITCLLTRTSNEIFVDTGANDHIIVDSRCVLQPELHRKSGVRIKTGNSISRITSIGPVSFNVKTAEGAMYMITRRALYANEEETGFRANLWSEPLDYDVYGTVTTFGPMNQMLLADGTIIPFEKDEQRRYVLRYSPIEKETTCTDRDGTTTTALKLKVPSPNPQLELWHRRLGHCSTKVIMRIPRHMVGIPDLSWTYAEANDLLRNCEICPMARLKPAPHKNNRTDTEIAAVKIQRNKFRTEFGECVLMDMAGPLIPSLGKGYRYTSLFVDDGTDSGWVYFADRKSEQKDLHQRFRTDTAQYGEVKEYHSDNGGEYMDHEYLKDVLEEGARRTFSVAYTPNLNNKAENTLWRLFCIARALLFEAGLPPVHWPFAVQHAMFLLNRIPVKRFISGEMVWRTPYLALNKRLPNGRHLKVWGSRCSVETLKLQRKKSEEPKFSPRAEIGYYMGRSVTRKAYIMFIPKEGCEKLDKGKYVERRTVLFHEEKTPRQIRERGVETTAPPQAGAGMPPPTDDESDFSMALTEGTRLGRQDQAKAEA